MKKYLLPLLCLMAVFLFGCNQNKEADPREKEIVQLVVNSRFDEATKRANEFYEGKELEETLKWISESKKLEEQRQETIKGLRPELKLEIQKGHASEVRGDYVYVTGRVKNVTDKDINYFEVIVKFLDENNQVLDSDYTNDSLKLKPGEMRSFEIMHRWSDDFKIYKLTMGDVR